MKKWKKTKDKKNESREDEKSKRRTLFKYRKRLNADEELTEKERRWRFLR